MFSKLNESTDGDEICPLPTFWVGKPGEALSGNQCNCNCACPEGLPAVGNSSAFADLTQRIQTGDIGVVRLAAETWRDQMGQYTVLLGQRADRVVIMGDRGASLLSYLSVPRTMAELHARHRNSSEMALAQLTALLLTENILSAPEADQLLPDLDRPDTLSVWLHLTDACNMACRYCYVPRTRNRMSVSLAERTVEAAYRSATAHDYSCVQLKYAGGEPTLNFPALRAAQQRAERITMESGIALDAVILTNGARLTDRQIEFLCFHNVGVVLSLDGLMTFQDSQRPLVHSRNSSFEQTAAALDRLLAQGISPRVSITLTAFSLDGLPDLVEYLLDRKVRFGFNFYRVPAEHRERAGMPDFTSQEMINGLRRAFAVIERRPPSYSLLRSLADRADLGLPHNRSCGAGRSYLVVDCAGQVSKCQMEMARPVTDISVLDPLGVLRADTQGLRALPADLTDCRECQWCYRCAGSCPRSNFVSAGRHDAKSPLCDVFRTILPEILRLEALRLLQYEKPWNDRPN